ncbi:esterase-like activity of phytase family protein, partial [Streptomyces sp. tea 10]|nr:esterase-like activity of phytase family protein [Streptomyces sp. tea 10]
ALLDGADLVGARTAAEVLAAVSDGVRVPAADVPALVRGLRSSRGGESARWRREAQRLERMAAHPALAGDGAAEGAEENTDAPPRGPESDVPDDVREGVVVALARPEWIARRMDAHGDQWLLASGTRAGLETGSPLRLTQLDRRTGHNLAQYVYETEPVSVPRGSTGGDRGASEMLQLSKADYLVIERQYVEGENQIQVYRASTKGATDVSRSAALTGTEIPMKKELIIDLAVSGMSPGNVEAVSFGPDFADGDASLVLAADDNFNLATQDTVFHLLRVNTHE